MQSFTALFVLLLAVAVLGWNEQPDCNADDATPLSELSYDISPIGLKTPPPSDAPWGSGAPTAQSLDDLNASFAVFGAEANRTLGKLDTDCSQCPGDDEVTDYIRLLHTECGKGFGHVNLAAINCFTDPAARDQHLALASQLMQSGSDSFVKSGPILASKIGVWSDECVRYVRKAIEVTEFMAGNIMPELELMIEQWQQPGADPVQLRQDNFGTTVAFLDKSMTTFDANCHL